MAPTSALAASRQTRPRNLKIPGIDTGRDQAYNGGEFFGPTLWATTLELPRAASYSASRLTRSEGDGQTEHPSREANSREKAQGD